MQRGFRGTGMEQVYNPRTLAELQAAQRSCRRRRRAAAGGRRRKAKDVYKNVQVLGDLSVGEFTRLMAAITATGCAPKEGCAYCHNLREPRRRRKYTKVVARRMLADDAAHQRRLEAARRRRPASPATPATAATPVPQYTSGS